MKYDRYVHLETYISHHQIKTIPGYGLVILLESELKRIPDFDHTTSLGKTFHVG